MSAKNTTVLLQRLRALMSNTEMVNPLIHAYIVPSGDAHLSEYIADCDERRKFISGFTGSAGTAVVTDTKAALWTDGRYYLQAESQLDANWQLMKEGLPDTPSQGDWLCKELPENGRVGVDPFLLSAAVWEPLQKQLQSDGHALVPLDRNLIDEIWDERPRAPLKTIRVHPMTLAGLSWQDKVTAVRAKMVEKNVAVLFLSALDEVAWLLNLRGADITFNPVFFSYCIVTHSSVLLFLDENKLLSDEVKCHLNSCADIADKPMVGLMPYGFMMPRLQQLIHGTPGKFWVSDKTNYAVFSLIPEDRRYVHPSPVSPMKAVKNAAEIEGMRRAHVKDAVAMCEFFLWLEGAKGRANEITAAEFLETLRSQQEDYVSLSFSTISAVGSNAAIIHYRPRVETNKAITCEFMYLLDSGAQYRDGTTDITRTIHLGYPTQYEKECYTRVLKGHIAIARAIFPSGTKGMQLDTLARQYLWNVGLNYQHGTGHGVGAFLNVHEGPCQIGHRARSDEVPLEEGMILSDEPGYYEDNRFGIRIESLVLVVKADTPNNFGGKGYLTFEVITLVPLQESFMALELMTREEINWVNDYHARCREVVGAEIQKQGGREDAWLWLKHNTEPISTCGCR